jgi:hypothetical protein
MSFLHVLYAREPAIKEIFGLLNPFTALPHGQTPTTNPAFSS